MKKWNWQHVVLKAFIDLTCDCIRSHEVIVFFRSLQITQWPTQKCTQYTFNSWFCEWTCVFAMAFSLLHFFFQAEFTSRHPVYYHLPCGIGPTGPQDRGSIWGLGRRVSGRQQVLYARDPVQAPAKPQGSRGEHSEWGQQTQQTQAFSVSFSLSSSLLRYHISSFIFSCYGLFL